MQLCVHAPLLHRKAGRRAMNFEICCVDLKCLLFTKIKGQTNQYLGEDALISPPLPTIVQRVVRPAFLGCSAPSQTDAIDKNIPTQNQSGVNTRFTVSFGKKGSRQAICSSHNQKKVRHVHRLFYARSITRRGGIQWVLSLDVFLRKIVGIDNFRIPGCQI